MEQETDRKHLRHGSTETATLRCNGKPRLANDRAGIEARRQHGRTASSWTSRYAACRPVEPAEAWQRSRTGIGDWPWLDGTSTGRVFAQRVVDAGIMRMIIYHRLRNPHLYRRFLYRPAKVLAKVKTISSRAVRGARLGS
jgi:hypothetical protein